MSTESALAPPAVSVVLPTYNRLHYLRPTVESVLAQTFPDWELIVADDGSDDATRAYLAGLAGDPRVTLLWLAHSGNPGAVRNAALRAARGDYIAFIDSDDLWMPRKLELQLAALRARPPTQWGYTAINHIDHSGAQINAALSARWVYYEGQIFERLLTLKAGVAMPTVMVSRKLLEQVGDFDEGLGEHEDYQLWLRLAMRSEISVLRQPLACVRVHSEHFSDFGTRSLEAWDRMYAQLLTLVGGSRRRAAVRTARAVNAARLAAAHAVAGDREATWSALANSWRFSWRSAAWWVAFARALCHLYLPARLLATVREYRRSTRPASPR